MTHPYTTLNNLFTIMIDLYPVHLNIRFLCSNEIRNTSLGSGKSLASNVYQAQFANSPLELAAAGAAAPTPKNSFMTLPKMMKLIKNPAQAEK